MVDSPRRAHARRALLETGFDVQRAGRRYGQYLRPLRAELRAARLAAYCLYEAPRLRRFVFQHGGQQAAEALADLISGRTSYRRLLTRAPLYLPRLGEWGSYRRELNES